MDTKGNIEKIARKERSLETNTSKQSKQIIDDGMKSRLEFEERWSDKFAKLLTDSFGSMWFLGANAAYFFIWIIINVNLIPGVKPFDPFPFGFLTMIVSLVAIFLSVIVLISQNRQGQIADIRQQIDFEINVRAEHEITRILIMLDEITAKLGIEKTSDDELKEMEETIDIHEIHQTLEQATS